jgi:hypothetical protein
LTQVKVRQRKPVYRKVNWARIPVEHRRSVLFARFLGAPVPFSRQLIATSSPAAGVPLRADRPEQRPGALVAFPAGILTYIKAGACCARVGKSREQKHPGICT